MGKGMLGYIKLHRQITENEFWSSEKFTKAQAWVDLLLLANHKHATLFIRGIEVVLKPGELCYSQLTLARRWKWNFKTVVKFLKMLEKRQMVETKTSNVTTVITILNWERYQGSGEQNGEQKESRMETNKNVKNEKNVFVEHLVQYLNDNGISYDETRLKSRIPKLLVDYAEDDVTSGVNEAVASWKKGCREDGDFVSYFCKTVQNNYKKAGNR
jgi:DNA-binding transcriptional regulator YhcF (GntR family)